jgi:hypothetical protein
MKRVLITKKVKRTLYTGKTQLLAYAANIAILARSLIDLKELLLKVEKHAKEVVLEISEKKTKYLIASRSDSTSFNRQNIKKNN